MSPTRWLVVVSVAALAVRIYAATRVGFGDAEALYLCYAAFPAPAYLDHPGLLGMLGHALGFDDGPSPLRVHILTAIAATLIPWAGALAARLAGADRGGASRAGLALVGAPEIAVGLFAFTPDLPLAALWLLAVGLFLLGVRKAPESATALFAFLGAFAAAGFATLTKASGALLLVGFAAALLRRANRRHLAGLGPWLGAAMAVVLLAPLLIYEARGGFPLLRHRLIDTQGEAGFSLRNVGALLGGQLAYVSPLVLGAAILLARDLARKAAVDERFDALATLTAVTTLALGLLCLWSKVAEPHWFAPALLGLAIYAGVVGTDALPRWLVRWAVPSGLALAAFVHLYALTELAPRFGGALYEARYDLSNDLYAWSAVLPVVRVLDAEAARAVESPVPVIGPHWIVAAQLKAGLGRDTAVGTAAARPDDFAEWLPQATWRAAPAVVWVSDDRFPEALPAALASWISRAGLTLEIRRGGRVVRRVRVEVLERQEAAALP